MPLDPNIILSGLQQQRGVDMNALLQQKISGMENINALERQRKSDELVMQDRAAKAAKEQEAAAIKALLPAYTYGIQTGDIAGAGNLAPPEMRGQLQPFIDALTGKSPQEVQAALIGSLASSGEVGQEALAAIQRGQTYGVQARQAKTAEDRLAFDIAQANKPGAGDFIAVSTDQGMYLLNKKTGEYTPMLPSETGIPGPRAVPEDAAAAAPAAVTAAPATPGAAAGAPQTGVLKPPPKAASTEQSQEERRRAASVRYTDKNAARVAEIIDKNPAAFGQGADEFLLSLLPFEAGENFKAFVQDADRQQLNYRMTQIVATLLRLETGAAYTKPELVTDAASFMQKYGDKPETARDKIDALQDRVSSAVGSTGRAWTPEDQAEYDAAMSALDAIKDKLYPVSGAAEGDAAANSVSEGATATNPQTGERLIYRDGQWQPL